MRKARSPKNYQVAGKKKKRDPYKAIPRPICLAPPQYQQQEVHGWKVRMILTGAPLAAVTLTCANLAQMMAVIATSATTSLYFNDQFRLKRTCVWGPVATAGTPVSVMLKYADDPANTATSGNPLTVGDTSVSFDRPAYACLEPPKNATSLFNNWLDSNQTIAVLVISAPVGSTIDFDFQFFVDDLGTPAAGPVLVGATAGNIYHKIQTLGGSTLSPVTPLNGI